MTSRGTPTRESAPDMSQNLCFSKRKQKNSITSMLVTLSSDKRGPPPVQEASQEEEPITHSRPPMATTFGLRMIHSIPQPSMPEDLRAQRQAKSMTLASKLSPELTNLLPRSALRRSRTTPKRQWKESITLPTWMTLIFTTQGPRMPWWNNKLRRSQDLRLMAQLSPIDPQALRITTLRRRSSIKFLWLMITRTIECENDEWECSGMN